MIAKDTTTTVNFFVTDNDGLPTTGQASNITATISINGGQASVISDTITEKGSGWYYFNHTFTSAGNAFIEFTATDCVIMPWEEEVVEISTSSAPSASTIASAVWNWTVTGIPGQNSMYSKVVSIPGSVWANSTRSLTSEILSVNKSLATNISASAIATAVWSDTTNYSGTTTKGYLQANGSGVWSQVAIHDSITGTDTTYGEVLKSRASSSNITSAKTAIINAMPDVSGLSTFDPSNDTVTINAAQAATMITATGFATPSDLSGLSTFNPSTDTVIIDSVQAATMATATGFATPSDLAGLSTFNPATDRVLINSEQASTMATATGFATPANITTAQAAIINHGDEHWQGGSDGATPEQVWSYSNRTLTAATLPNNSSLATSTDITASTAAIKGYGDNNWITATGFATPTDLNGLSTFNSATDTVIINSEQAATMVTATGFSTPSDINDVLDAINNIDIDTSDLATSTEVAVLADLQKDLNAGVLNWSVTANALTIYNDNNTVRATYTLTRDADGNITRIQPNT
ncbi:MAG: hypothetical protein IJG38_05005 [Thermoguttaceae bacterium]|nr:hypothetical protein [Thermoguttaceae bacterium]